MNGRCQTRVGHSGPSGALPIHIRYGPVYQFHVRAARGNERSGPVRARIGPETGRPNASVNQPFPRTRPDRPWLAARPGSAPLNDLGRPALTAHESADVPEVSPPSLLPPSALVLRSLVGPPLSWASPLCGLPIATVAPRGVRVTYIVNTLYLFVL